MAMGLGLWAKVHRARAMGPTTRASLFKSDCDEQNKSYHTSLGNVKIDNGVRGILLGMLPESTVGKCLRRIAVSVSDRVVEKRQDAKQ